MTDDSWRDLLQGAVQAHQHGAFDEAEALYRQVLALRPDEPNALTNIGTLNLQQGRLAEGVAFIDASLAVRPDQPAALANKGRALTALGRLDEALDCGLKARALQPDNPDVHNNLGEALRQLDRPLEALEAYDTASALNPAFEAAAANKAKLLGQLGRSGEALAQADRWLAINPDRADAWNERGNALVALNRAPEALAAYERALAIDGVHAEGLANMAQILERLGRRDDALAAAERAVTEWPGHAGAHYAAGNVLMAARRYPEALAAFERAIALDPGHLAAWINLGVARQRTGRYAEALATFDAIVAHHPDSAPAQTNRGSVLRELERFDEADTAYAAALALDPADTGALRNMAISLAGHERYDDAIAYLDRALAIDPDMAPAQWTKAHLCLLLGRYDEGWPLFESRWRASSMPGPDPGRPQWTGQPVAGKTVLIVGEQGLGDTLQMLRYAPLLAERGARVVLKLQPALVEIARTVPGVAEVVGDETPDLPFDLFCSAMSLPLGFGGLIPGNVPYVGAAADKVQAWADRLGPRTRPRVGVVWSGGHWANQPEVWSVHSRRNMALAKLRPLAGAPVDFYSLQKGEPAETELADAIREGWGGPALIDHTGALRDFSDTAALMANLDLVIAVDTSMCHLAGALGRPVWLLNRYDTCWRWLLDREDTPWYPTMRIFRQESYNDWGPVVARVRRELDRLA